MASVTLPCLVSGGAHGADECWSRDGARLGYEIHVYSFAGHRRSGKHTRLFEITNSDRSHYSFTLQQAAVHLGRRLDLANGYVRDLLCRNGLVAHRGDAMLAVVADTPRGSRNRTLDCGVMGGTGWTCQLFVDRHARSNKQVLLFVFSESERKWLQASIVGTAVFWTRVLSPVPAVQHCEAIAVVGGRAIGPRGRSAIANILHDMASPRY